MTAPVVPPSPRRPALRAQDRIVPPLPDLSQAAPAATGQRQGQGKANPGPVAGRANDPRLEQLVEALTAAAAGDFSRKLEVPDSAGGEDDVVDRLAILVRFMLDDLARADASRIQELERLKELDRMKSRFVNTAAHELGTPLTPMRMQLHMLKARRLGPTTPEQDRALGILDRNLDRVVSLAADMLSISRMEAGQLTLRKAPMDMGALVREAGESFVANALARGVRLEVAVQQPYWVEADAARLAQVLDNLVTNAIKFTPSEGAVLVRCRARGAEVVVEVQDTGIGVTSDEIAKLFQPFGKLADHSPHGDPGTGLGLFISKGLIERHGGLMWIDSPGKGKGTTVGFALPLSRPPASAAA